VANKTGKILGLVELKVQWKRQKNINQVNVSLQIMLVVNIYVIQLKTKKEQRSLLRIQRSLLWALQEEGLCDCPQGKRRGKREK
jgi:hypothetical protein